MQRIITILATFFYSGLLPKMPGTWGSLAALPFAWFLWLLPPAYAWSIFFLSTIIGIWAAHQYVLKTKTDDNQQIVVDEALGIFLTASIAHHTWIHYLAVFLFFRLFDIWKPWPVNWCDEKIKGGLGVVLDDIAAAGWALLCMYVLGKFL